MSDWTMEMIKKGYGLPPLNTEDIAMQNIHYQNFDENNLVSAEEARELSGNACSFECQFELSKASKSIQEAIDKGEYYCWCSYYLHNQAINRLRKLGYAVTNCSTQIDGDLFKIEW